MHIKIEAYNLVQGSNENIINVQASATQALQQKHAELDLKD